MEIVSMVKGVTSRLKHKVSGNYVNNYTKQSRDNSQSSFAHNKNNSYRKRLQSHIPRKSPTWNKNGQDFLETPTYMDWRSMRTPLLERAAEILPDRIMWENHKICR